MSGGSGDAPVGPVRLQKLLAGAGVASRRAAEALIRDGRVAVNGVVAKVGDRADPFVDDITLDGESLRAENASYWLVNKPKGVLTTLSDPEGRPTIVSLLPDTEHRLFPVGRLDLDTEGLVLMTNDGELANRMLHPSLEVERSHSDALQRPHRMAQREQRAADLTLAPLANREMERGVVPRLVVAHALDASGPGRAVVESNAPRELLARLLLEEATHAHDVLPLHLVGGVQHAMGQLAVVRHQHQPFGVEVQAAHRKQPMLGVGQ